MILCQCDTGTEFTWNRLNILKRLSFVSLFLILFSLHIKRWRKEFHIHYYPLYRYLLFILYNGWYFWHIGLEQNVREVRRLCFAERVRNGRASSYVSGHCFLITGLHLLLGDALAAFAQHVCIICARHDLTSIILCSLFVIWSYNANLLIIVCVPILIVIIIVIVTSNFITYVKENLVEVLFKSY